MNCQQFRDALLRAVSIETIEAAFESHSRCDKRDCADALRTARILAKPLSVWAAPIETEFQTDLSSEVLAELNARSLREQQRRPWKSVLAVAATVAAAALFAVIRTSPSAGEVAASTPYGSTTTAVDPVAVAYVEKTERWLAETARQPINTDFKVSFEQPTEWFNSTLKPLAESLDLLVPIEGGESSEPTT